MTRIVNISLIILLEIVFLAVFAAGEEIPSNWTGDTGIELFRESSIVQEGSYSCEVIVNTGIQENCEMYHDQINVTPGSSYTYSFYIQTSEHVTARVILQWTGDIITTANYSPISPSSFTQVTFSGTVPLGVSDVKIGVRFYDQAGFAAPETQYVDNFTFESPSGTPISLANGDMESWPSIPTPITLGFFTATPMNGNVQVLWETATETNNSRFLIYRNEDIIAHVEGAGTTSEPRSYEYLDDQVVPGNTYTYVLADVSYAHKETKYSDLAVTVTIPEYDVPVEFALEDNYPNPFNPATALNYQLPADSDVELSIFDMNGRKIATLINDHVSAGYYHITWNASKFSSGIYFYRLTARDPETSSGQVFVETKKMVLIK